MKKYLYIFILIPILCSLLYFLFLQSETKGSGSCEVIEGNISSPIILINDYIYFLEKNDYLRKVSKHTLDIADSLYIEGCRTIRYSNYHNQLLIVKPGLESTIYFVDYDNMNIDDSTVIASWIEDLIVDGDKLYTISDGSGLVEGDLYSIDELESYTGILTEYLLPEFIKTWDTSIGTIPQWIEICSNYIITSSEEYKLIDDGNDELYMNSNIVNIYDLSTRELHEFIVGLNVFTHIEVDGVSKVFISNPNYVYEYFTDPGFGLSVIDLATMVINHIQIEAPSAGSDGFAVGATQLIGDDLFMAFFQGGADTEKTYFGKYNLLTEELDVTEIMDVSQHLGYLLVDGNVRFFVTADGWLIKYTMD